MATIDRVKSLLGNAKALGVDTAPMRPSERVRLMYQTRDIGVANLTPGYNSGFPGGNWTWRRPRARFDPMILPAWARGVELISRSLASAPREYKGDAKWARLMLMPNARTSESEFWRLTMYFILNYGNAFWVLKDGALYSRHPTSLEFNEKRDIDKEGRMTYRFRDLSGYRESYDEDEILHFKGSADNPYIALSPTQRYGLIFDGIQDALEFGIKFFKNSAVAQGLLVLPESYDDQIDNERLHEMKMTWNDQFQGDNAHGIAVVAHGTDYKPMQIDPKKAQMLETNVYYLKVIAQLLGLQPYQIGDTSASTYNNLEAANTAFVHTTIRPWLDTLADQLYVRAGLRMSFDLTQLLAGSRSEEVAIDLQMVNAKVMSIEEFRAKHKIGQ